MKNDLPTAVSNGADTTEMAPPIANDANFLSINAKTKNTIKNKKLSLDEKRMILMEWFTSRDASTGKPLRIKNLPAAKPFVRKAVRELKLQELRKIRNRAVKEDKMGTVGRVDMVAKQRIENYRPRAKKQGKGMKQDGNKRDEAKMFKTSIEAGDKQMDAISTDQIRSVLLEFYSDSSCIPLGRFLRNAGLLRHKSTILPVVRATKLRRMKCDGMDVGEVENKLDVVLAAMDKADSEGKGKIQKDAKGEESFETCITHMEGMQLTNDTDGGKNTVVDTKKGVGKKQEHKKLQKDKAKCILASNPNLLATPGLQGLVMEWYASPSKPSIIEFLKEKENMEVKRAMRLIVKAAGLQRMRKEGAAQEEAAAAINKIFADVTSPCAEVSLKKNKAIPTIQQQLFQTFLTEWFYDENMISIPDFLEAKGHSELRPVMAKTATRLGLRQLRKDRKIIAKMANRRIGMAFDENKKLAELGMGTKKKSASCNMPKKGSEKDFDMAQEEKEYVTVHAQDAVEDRNDMFPPSYEAVSTATATEEGKDLEFVVLH